MTLQGVALMTLEMEAYAEMSLLAAWRRKWAKEEAGIVNFVTNSSASSPKLSSNTRKLIFA
jgi:hypothetical protein